jgi:N-acetylneuraminic acid mutarotase
VKIEQDVEGIKALMVQMFEKLRFLENTIQISSAINYASNVLIEDILVAGGWDSDGNPLKSVERFSWKNNMWERVSSMNVGRKGATSFVYENQVFLAGGCDSRVIEVLNLNEGPLQWDESIAKVPYHCEPRSVVYQNRAVLFCACVKTDYCTELCLTAPYPCKQLCKMPEPARKHYTVVAFEHKVLIFGGSSGSEYDVLDSVLELNVSTNKFKDMPPLPYAVSNMAGVRWGDQAVLIGGFDQDGPSKKVLMYDSKTGNTTELPSMLEERSASAAVITGNTIVVMGGKGKPGRLRSVEAFTLGSYSWRYLPAMNDIRSVATATVVPTKYFR